MNTLNWDEEFIHVRNCTDMWGPFAFSCAEALPADTIISQAVVKSYRVNDNFDTTSLLIEPESTIILDTTLTLKLQYPGREYIGLHYLVFEVELSGSAAKHSFVFGYVLVE